MTIEDDDTLLEDEDTDGCPASVTKTLSGDLDPRRLIERRLELKRLREQLEDPGFCYDFD